MSKSLSKTEKHSVDTYFLPEGRDGQGGSQPRGLRLRSSRGPSLEPETHDTRSSAIVQHFAEQRVGVRAPRGGASPSPPLPRQSARLALWRRGKTSELALARRRPRGSEAGRHCSWSHRKLILEPGGEPGSVRAQGLYACPCQHVCVCVCVCVCVRVWRALAAKLQGPVTLVSLTSDNCPLIGLGPHLTLIRDLQAATWVVLLKPRS